jgi:hypothetical protein
MTLLVLGGNMKGITKFAALIIAIAASLLFSEYAHCAPLRLATINSEKTEVHIVSGPQDAVYVLWFDRDEELDDGTAAIDIYFTRSLDGGASFDETVIIENGDPPDTGVSYPRMAVDGDGMLYIVYCKYDYQEDYQDGQFSIIVNKSEDEGATFVRETVYTEHMGDLLTCENFLFHGADIKIAHNRLYYTWSGYREIFLARSNGENKFEVLDVEHEGNEDAYASSKVNPSLAVDLNNNVYVTWMEAHSFEGSAEFNFNLYISKLANDQQQFSEIKMIGELDSTGEFMGRPLIVTHSADSIFIAYNTPTGCMKLSSENGGESFSNPLKTTFGIDSEVLNFKTIMDPSDVMHFLYVSFDASSTLYYSKSRDYGESMEDTVKVSPQEADTADMDWNDTKDMAYIAWFTQQDNSIYFSNSLEGASEVQPPAPNPEPSKTDGGGSGGGGCFIHSILDRSCR